MVIAVVIMKNENRGALVQCGSAGGSGMTEELAVVMEVVLAVATVVVPAMVGAILE